jgi:hypothetical protein
MKSKSAAVNRARQFALIIGNSSCAMSPLMASQNRNETKHGKWDRCSLATDEHRFTRIEDAEF